MNDKHYHKMQFRSCVVNCWRENKNNANWCAQQCSGVPRRTANIILLNLYFFTEISLFPCKKCFPTIKKIN